MGVMDEENIKAAAKLYAARDTVRRIQGDGYPGPAIRRAMEALQAESKKGDVPVLQLAIHAAKVAEERGHGVLALTYLTAAVEIIEPSTPKKAGP